MTDEEKEAIEYFKNMLSFYYHNAQICTHDKMQILLNLIEKQQKEIEKQDKIIDLMARSIAEEKCFAPQSLIIHEQVLEDMKREIKEDFEKEASKDV